VKRTLTLAGMMLGLLGTLFLAAPTEAQPPRYKLQGNQLVLAQPGDAGPLFVEERLGQFVPVPGGKAKASPPAAAAEPKKIGPVAGVIIRLEVAKHLMKKDPSLSRHAALKKAREIADDDTLNALAPDAEKVAGQKFGAIGDGSIWQAIVDFIKSPAGQALIKALIDMIIHMIGAHGPDMLHAGDGFALAPLYLDQRDLIYQWSHALAA
jgi:hypothetical protein